MRMAPTLAVWVPFSYARSCQRRVPTRVIRVRDRPYAMSLRYASRAVVCAARTSPLAPIPSSAQAGE